MKAESGATRVVVFDHTLRTADDVAREARKIREVVPRVHNDYTEWSGPQRVRDLLPNEADDLLRGRSRSFKCGGRSAIRSRRFRSRSAMPARCRRRTSSSRSGAIRTAWAGPAITYSPDHVWYWFPRMRREEALVFKTSSRLRTAARAGPRTRRSTTRPRWPMPGRARASKSARSRFLMPAVRTRRAFSRGTPLGLFWNICQWPILPRQWVRSA